MPVAERTRKRKKNHKTEYYFDYSLLFVILFLLGFGMLMIYSASSYTAYLDYNGDSAHYLKKQLLACILGMIAMTVVANIPYHFWERFAILAYIFSIAIIPVVKTPLGISSHGATRWFKIPGIGLQVQPAEIVKLCMILFLACLVCKLGRNAEFQAIIPVRGKTLNCMKSTYEKIFASDIIVDLLRVIGCGVELNGKVKTDIAAFDINMLRWSKIIICTDADEDGFQIRTLLLTLFYRLLPTLLKEHKVFIAESPLFEITTKDKIYFAYNEFEKAEILKELGTQKYTLQRSKGLGENEPEMMWQTTMNPETRRLISVTPADAKLTEQIFDTLMGDNLPARKVFIAEHGSEYLKDADI